MFFDAGGFISMAFYALFQNLFAPLFFCKLHLNLARYNASGGAKELIGHQGVQELARAVVGPDLHQIRAS